MKISLSLCLFLTLTFSVLACNQSDPFNQKRSDTQEEIKTGLDENNQQPASKNFVNKYMIPGLNIAFTGAALVVGAKLYKEGTLGGYLPLLMIQSALNTASMIDAPKSSPVNTIVGVTNLVSAGITYFAVKPLSTFMAYSLGLDPIVPIYFTCQSAVSLFNAAYKLWYVKKQQN